MGLPKIEPGISLSRQVKPDLVGMLLAHHRDRIVFPCLLSEVTDLAQEFSHVYNQHITEQEVRRAMSQAAAWVEDFE